MSWIDIAAAISAQRHAHKPVVTASIDDLHFIAPIRVGWFVNLKASVNLVSKTSMEIGVRVESENPMTGELFHTASAYLTFVALDVNGKPTSVAPLKIENSAEQRRHDAALERRRLRLEKRKLLEKFKQ